MNTDLIEEINNGASKAEDASHHRSKEGKS